MADDEAYLDKRYRKNSDFKIKLLERKIQELENELRWKNLEDDGLPDLSEEVIMIDCCTFMHGYFYQNLNPGMNYGYISFHDYILDRDFNLHDLSEDVSWKYTREDEIEEDI